MIKLRFMDFFIIDNIKDFLEITVWLFWWLIAFLWLNTWKKQIKWNIEFDTARKILNQIYKIRRWIETVRNPFIPAYEMIYKWTKDGLSEKELEIAWLREAYNNRFELLDKTKQEILLDVLEAEVLWGKDIKNKLYDFLWVVRELELAVQDYLKIKHMSNLERQESYWKERYSEVDEIIYAKSLNSIEINKDDKYALNLDSKIKDIENYLKKFLIK